METLGKTLKSLREEKGMTLTDVSKATKIRVPVLAALENEEWDKLPQKIFIKGFVKAYAKAVDGDETLLMDLFESSCPVEDEKIACPAFEAKPMDSLVREKRSYKWVFVLILLILIAGGLYLLYPKIADFFQETTQAPVKEETTIVVPPKETGEKPAPADSEPPPLNSEESVTSTQTTPSVSTTAGSAVQEPAETTEPKAREETAAPVVTEKVASPPQKSNTENAAVPPTETKPEEKANNNLIITAKMETWIGLKIDGKTRKEILLKPGKTFSTKVDRFVELLIGNAGGIDITFNGEKIENIGKPGQVVRLRLPRKEPTETKKETPAP